jgi:hypothetical protein
MFKIKGSFIIVFQKKRLWCYKTKSSYGMWKKNNKLCTNDVLNMLYKNYLEKKKEYRNHGIIIKMKKKVHSKKNIQKIVLEI